MTEVQGWILLVLVALAAVPLWDIAIGLKSIHKELVESNARQRDAAFRNARRNETQCIGSALNNIHKELVESNLRQRDAAFRDALRNSR